jgi:hypothetical protein
MPRPLRFLPRLTWLLAAAVLVLAGCQRSTDESRPGGDSPTAAARLLIDDLRHDDLAAFWKHGLPPADHAALVERWRQAQAAQAVTDAAREGYRQFMDSLTRPGAKAALARDLQERAAQIADRYGDQVPVLVAIGGAVLARIVVADVALRPTQQQGLHDALAPVLQWAQQAPWLDRERAGRAASIAVDTARSLQLATLDQARALDLPTAMAKTSRLWIGAKQALALYGLSLDAVLDSAKLTLVSQQAGVAHVRIDYLLKGQPQQVVLKMREVDDRWYPAATPQLARAVAPPDWDGWWGPSRVHVGYITTGRDAGASPVQ